MATNQINESLKAAGAAAAKAIAKATAQKLRDFMLLIDGEMADNDGIYPHGRLSQRELCRRAGLHYQTLQAPSHVDTIKLEVDAWLEAKKTKTQKAARKEVTNRAEHWKEQHGKVATQISVYEAELAEKDGEIAEKDEKITGLEEEVARLRELVAQLQKSTVTPLTSVRKGKK